MPIRPENKARYPKDWSTISSQIRARADNKCEECGVPNYELGGRAPDGTWHKALPLGEKLLKLEWPAPGDHAWCSGYDLDPLRIVKIVLTVAHLDHQPENCAPENLKCWCQRCHNRYDMVERKKGIAERARLSRASGDLFAAETR